MGKISKEVQFIKEVAKKGDRKMVQDAIVLVVMAGVFKAFARGEIR